MKNFRRQIENQKHLKRRYMMDNLQQMEQEKHVLRWGGLGEILRWYLPDANFRRAATHRLQIHFSDTSEQVWRSTRTWQSRLAPSRPHHSASVNLMMR
jgi:hypothetical protein